jgi:hypothetical protein
MRNLCFVGCISVTVRKLPFTHVGNNVLDGEHRRALEPRNIRLMRLMAALQNGCYAGYGHLYFSFVNGGEKYIRLVALTTQIIVKFSDQALDPRGPRRRPLASRHYGGWLGFFVETLGGCLTKGKGCGVTVHWGDYCSFFFFVVLCLEISLMASLSL